MLIGEPGITTNVNENAADFTDSPAALDAVNCKVCEPGVKAGNVAEQLNGEVVPMQVIETKLIPIVAISG